MHSLLADVVWGGPADSLDLEEVLFQFREKDHLDLILPSTSSWARAAGIIWEGRKAETVLVSQQRSVYW